MHNPHAALSVYFDEICNSTHTGNHPTTIGRHLRHVEPCTSIILFG